MDRMVPVDYDGDGKLDLLGSSNQYLSNGLFWWKGEGDGTFRAKSSILQGYNTESDIVVADATGDGSSDVIAIVRRGFDQLLIVPDTGSGERPALIQYLPGLQDIYAMTTIQRDSDPAVEMVAGGNRGLDVYDDIGTTPRRVLSIPTALTPTGIVSADFDGDGHDDIAVAMRLLDERRLQLYFGKADGTFETPVVLPSLYPYRLVVGDLDEDGRPDFAASNFDKINYSSTTRTAPASIYLNQGGRNFVRSEVPLAGLGWYDVADGLALEDVSGDGHLDLLAGVFGNIATVAGGGDGTFFTPTFQPQVRWGVAGDFNGDGRPELGLLGEQLALATGICATQVALKPLPSVSYNDSFGVAIPVGQEVALSAQVSGFGHDLPLPLGTVTLRDGTEVVASSPAGADGKASFSVAGLGVGTHFLSAVFEGNAALPPAPSAVVEQIVVSQETEILVSLPDSLPVYGELLPLLVTMNNPWWPGVALDVDGVIQSIDLGKPVPLSLGPGSHTIVATHHGGFWTPPGQSAPVTFSIAKGNPVLDTNSALVVRESNDSVSFSVTGSGALGPSGSVQLFEGTTTVGSGVLVDGAAIVNVALSRGVHEVRAVYSGDTRYREVSRNLRFEALWNLPFPIEAQAMSDGIRIAYVLPRFAMKESLLLFRRPAGTTQWETVPGWNADTGMDTSVPRRGLTYEYRLFVAHTNAYRSFSNLSSAALPSRRRAVSPP